MTRSARGCPVTRAASFVSFSCPHKKMKKAESKEPVEHIANHCHLRGLPGGDDDFLEHGLGGIQRTIDQFSKGWLSQFEK